MSTRSPSVRTAKKRINADDPWQLIWGQPYIDADRLAAAIESDLLATPSPDFRTRLLVRDAARAISRFWGEEKFSLWLRKSAAGERIANILKEPLGRTGFSNIRRRLVSTIGVSQVRQIFELLGENVHDRVEVNIAGSIPTLIKGLTARPTTDIDFVDEIPEGIRKQTAKIRQINAKFGLTLEHVQSHDLPARWETRRQYLGDFGGLRVYLVDPYDIFVSKLSSKQERHKDDLRVLAQSLDKTVAKERLLKDGKEFVGDPYQRPQIEKNWAFVFQEALEASATSNGGNTPRT